MLSIQKLYDENSNKLYDLIGTGKVQISSDGTPCTKYIPFSKCHAIVVKEILPWYAILYIYFRVYKRKLFGRADLNFSKGLFKSWLTSKNIGIVVRWKY